MKAQTRFGPGWTWVALVVIFAPIAAFALLGTADPAVGENGWFIALAFSGFPLFIAIMAVQVPWRRRLILPEGSTLRVVREKDGRQDFLLDASLAWSGHLELREGRVGKYGNTLVRWVQARFGQEGRELALEFGEAQRIQPAQPPFEALPGPADCEALRPLLGLDFVVDESALDRAAGKPPSARIGKPRFLQCEGEPAELVAFLEANRGGNLWRRDPAVALEP